MFKVCIVDDVLEDAIRVKDIVHSFNEDFKIDIYQNSVDREIIDGNYNLYLLDIDMDKLNGIELGKKIKEKNRNNDIIFVSRREDLVFETFSVGILYFVRKSNLNDDLIKALEVIYDRYNQNSKVYNYQHRGIDLDIRYIDILFFEVFKNDLIIHTKDKEFRQRKTLNQVADELNDRCFEKISKSFIINYENIKEFNDNEIVMINNEVITLNKRKLREYKAKYFQYLAERSKR